MYNYPGNSGEFYNVYLLMILSFFKKVRACLNYKNTDYDTIDIFVSYYPTTYSPVSDCPASSALPPNHLP